MNPKSAKKSEQEKEPECDFKFKGSCLNPRIVLAVFIVLVLLIILVLVSIYVCLCKKYFSQRRDQMNDQGTGQYPANQLHDGTITAKVNSFSALSLHHLCPSPLKTITARDKTKTSRSCLSLKILDLLLKFVLTRRSSVTRVQHSSKTLIWRNERALLFRPDLLRLRKKR